MNKNIIYSLIVGFSCSLSACSDWVDIKTKGKLIPEETVNYRYLMNNTENFRYTLSYQEVASDDIYVSDETQQAAIYETDKFIPVYTWADEIYSQSENDGEMNKVYQIIYNMNVVIDEVMDSKNGTQAEKLAIRAEALVHRADAYLALVNVYGKPYNEATAVTDQGVPLLTTPRVEGSLPRASVAKVYEQIIQDLDDAFEYLSDVPEFNFYPSKCAVYALKARAYLLMGNYTEAKINAVEALKLQDGLENLNTYIDGSVAYPRNMDDKEVIFAKLPVNAFRVESWGGASQLVLSDDLLNMFDKEHDLRYRYFTRSMEDLGMTYSGRVHYKNNLYASSYPTYETRNMGPCVPEMMLIEAECWAREGEIEEAMSLVNDLREYRYAEGEDYTLSAATAKEALGHVLQERRRELMCHGLRWLDQRRLTNDPDFPTQTVTRVFKGTTYTLTPGAVRYTFPMGELYLEENPEIGQIK
ncbi:RagB/SusD family nutrient uptake outer membrane protein [Butyricimonas paravirosa]|uniref:RagB/SusD family nutrient uptake outer membrane protein n=1 Tax=Butyricimonas paravirosa TaxID=1472417 RepID=UPI0021095034|nr:RagB/SusD family nutrient uptake outer membrane protein [Butyricimonas paravirosa]MCQ4874188.1 RagB/SusD family nutrient uptake outer membrane protein [Butyricimonas paravirosa]